MKSVRWIFALSLGCFISFSAYAAIPGLKPEKARNHLENRTQGLISSVTHERLSRAHAMMQKKDYASALGILEKLEESTKSRPFEFAQVTQAKGFMYAQQGDYKKALASLKNALATNALPKGPHLSTLYTVAQLQATSNQYEAAKKSLLEWFGYQENPAGQAYALIASIESELGNKKSALENVDKAISLDPKPNESWLRFSVSLNFELGRYSEAAKSLGILIAQNPNEASYWKQLSAAYLNGERDPEALASMELALKMNHLKEGSEYLNLTSLFLGNGIPYRGAQVLAGVIESGQLKRTQKNLQILAQSWLQAQEVEKAISPMTEAAELSKDGELYAQLGQLYLDLQKETEALKAFSKALQKGGLKAPGRVHLALGLARFNSKDWQPAKKAFLQAAKYDDTAQSAKQWLMHLDEQIKSQKLMARKEVSEGH